jgi:hypothetical protein
MTKRIQGKEEEDTISGAEERIASPQDRYPDKDHEIPEEIQRAFDDGAISNEY